MNRIVKFAAIALLIATATGCAEDKESSAFSTFSYKLNQGMTERQVVDALGYKPTSVSLETCGSSTPNPFQCKIFLYQYNGYNLKSLYIYFIYIPNKGWLVNSWSTSVL